MKSEHQELIDKRIREAQAAGAYTHSVYIYENANKKDCYGINIYAFRRGGV